MLFQRTSTILGAVLLLIATFLINAVANTAFAAPNSRYVISKNSSEVYDTQTDLTWQRCSVGLHWKADQRKCVAGKRGGAEFSFDEAQKQAHDKWRVPTIDELKSLIDQSHKPGIDPEAFPDQHFFEEDMHYWSSTAQGDSSACGVDFYMGIPSCGLGRGGLFGVRLVRSGQ